jgi:hypothetical protein
MLLNNKLERLSLANNFFNEALCFEAWSEPTWAVNLMKLILMLFALLSYAWLSRNIS